jgi:probable phosphoglycerate mutase
MRHGEAAYVAEDGTVTDDPRNVTLTANGRIQARKQAAVLASVPFDRAICSGLPRTRETATLVLAGRETPILEVVPELEEINGGGGDQPIADRRAWLKHVANPWAGADHPEATFMGGERFVDFSGRVTPAFDAIVADPSWQTLLLVLHGAVNRMIFNHVLGLSWQARVTIEQDNCCINVVDVDTDPKGEVSRFLVRVVNLTSYDLNKSDVFLTSMEHTAARISEQMFD